MQERLLLQAVFFGGVIFAIFGVRTPHLNRAVGRLEGWNMCPFANFQGVQELDRAYWHPRILLAIFIENLWQAICSTSDSFSVCILRKRMESDETTDHSWFKSSQARFCPRLIAPLLVKLSHPRACQTRASLYSTCRRLSPRALDSASSHTMHCAYPFMVTASFLSWNSPEKCVCSSLALLRFICYWSNGDSHEAHFTTCTWTSSPLTTTRDAT